MPQPPDPVAIVTERSQVTRALTERLMDIRLVATALLFSGILAALSAVAVFVPWVWLLVTLLIGVWFEVWSRFRRSQAGAIQGLLALESAEETRSPSAREALRAVPPWWLDVEEMAGPDQLERTLLPAGEDRFAQRRAMPLAHLADLAIAVLFFAGIVMAVLAPSLHILVFWRTLSSDDLLLLASVAASIPLLSLGRVGVWVSGFGHEAFRRALAAAEDALPRFWAYDPEFRSGRFIVREEDGYRLDPSVHPAGRPPSPITVALYRAGPWILAAVVVLDLLLVALGLLER
jgi:hypothetical protein